MATKTSTSTKTHITQKGNVFVVKDVVTKTTTSPGKDPVVEVTESVKEYEGLENLPEDLRKEFDRKPTQPLNMKATRGNFAEDVLKEVNKYRKFHGSPSLTLSKKLTSHCQDRTKKMAEADEMLDAGNDQFGESVTCISSNDPEFYVRAEDVASRWYASGEGYDYSKEPKELTAGRFTEMLWKNSKEFGIAASKSKTNKIYIVACFNPRGNYSKEFIENVCPPERKGKSAVSNGKSFFNIFDKPKTPKPGSGSLVVIDQLNSDSVECHNAYRKRHGVPPLTYSKQLADYAQEWANELARTERFEHRSQGTFGENLYFAYNSDPKKVPEAAEACDSWYSEIEGYKFGKEPLSMGAGHFTQMVWKDTREVGMARAKSKSGRHYIVANYNPPGNFIGKFTENVPKPRS